ncbi:MAG: translation initiation factor IF-2 N-terminal domain-containing protein, partial [Solirubrobacterales bacterium]|nr:translation initiation factor IF-2 N-terminal domain-containing protein [Solirubrobacterales bacterium]
MMNKRVHEIAKERGLPARDVVERLRAAGLNVKAPSSTVDEDAALRALGNGGGTAGRAEEASPAAPPDRSDGGPAESAARGPNGEPAHKRPTRDSLQGERAPGTPGGRRRVVIDSQASRRAPTGGGPAQPGQPPRRQRRGRRRRGIYDEEAEARPAATTAVAEPNATRINSGSTVKDVAEYLDVHLPEVMKKLMALGEMKTLTQTLSDEAIQVLAAEFGKD